MRYLYPLAILLTLFPFPAPAQAPNAFPPVVLQPLHDAQGNPLAGATVRITFDPLPGEAQPPTGDFVTADDGTVPLPTASNQARKGHAIISHPDFGRASATLGGHDFRQPILLPLVKKDSPAQERALTGTITAPDGRPAAHAAVRCTEVRTPGMGLLASHQPVAALSDEQGRFTFYLPSPRLPGGKPANGLVPANSQYHITIDPPDGSTFPYAGVHPNTAPAEIRLEKGKRQYTFTFESPAGGRVQDPQQLRNMRVYYQKTPRSPRIHLPGKWLHSGGLLLPGTYHASASDLEYQPLTVTNDSPAELLFKLPPPLRYRGRVIDGVTGKPAAGAFVMAMTSLRYNNLAVLTDGHWQQLLALPHDPAMDEPVIKHIADHLYSFETIIRSAPDGTFEITKKPGRQIYSLIIFDKDRLPIARRLYNLKPDENHQADLGDIPLFPSATVTVKPAANEQNLAVSPRWVFAPAGQPEWFDAFQRAHNSRDLEFAYVHWLKLNEPQPVFVPAAVKLRLRLETPYSDQYASTQPPRDIQLEPGKSLNLGEIPLPKSLKLRVRVVGADGNPVEGAPVRRLHAHEDTWNIASNTDAEGLADVHVHPHSAGQIAVRDIPGHRNAGNLAIPFTVRDKVEIEGPLTITLTAGQLESLRTRKPE